MSPRILLGPLLAAGLALTACAPAPDVGLPEPPEHAATLPASRAEKGWWRRHGNLRERVDRRRDARVVLIGDSLTQGWGEAHGLPAYRDLLAPLGALSLGLGGDMTQHLLWRLRDGLLSGLEPEVVVLMIGTNNLLDAHPPEQIADGIVAVVRTLLLQLPEARVLVLDPLPIGARPTHPKRAALREVAGLLARLDGVPRVERAHFDAIFLAGEGRLNTPLYNPKDMVHLTEEGYRALATALAARLGELGVEPRLSR